MTMVTCYACRRGIKLRKDGTFWPHNDTTQPPGWRPAGRCPGSGKTPDEIELDTRWPEQAIGA